jgi:hypothetical protein
MTLKECGQGRPLTYLNPMGKISFNVKNEKSMISATPNLPIMYDKHGVTCNMQF